MKKRYIPLIMAAAGAMFSCASDEPNLPELPEGTYVDVPLNIAVTGDWSVSDDDEGDTRAKPPGAGGGGGESTTEEYDYVDGWDDTQGVNCVRVITFRRKDQTDVKKGPDYVEPDFIYDGANDILLTTFTNEFRTANDNWGNITGHQHRVASGNNVRLVLGYEYKFIAIAYNTDRENPYASYGNAKDKLPTSFTDKGEQHLFSLNTASGLKYEDLTMTFNHQRLTNSSDTWREFMTGDPRTSSESKTKDVLHAGSSGDSYVSSVPQIFYGKLHMNITTSGVTTSTGEVVKFTDTKGEDGKTIGTTAGDALCLTGILYRGMARVDIKYSSIQKFHSSSQVWRDIYWLIPMVQCLRWNVNLSSYDGFLLPHNMPTNDYVSASNGSYHWSGVGIAHNNGSAISGKEYTMTFYLPPCKTSLALRHNIYYYYSGAGVGGNQCRNTLIVVDDVSNGSSATGVISPDAVNNVFYFRRNHKYKITIDGSKIENIFDSTHDISAADDPDPTDEEDNK